MSVFFASKFNVSNPQSISSEVVRQFMISMPPDTVELETVSKMESSTTQSKLAGGMSGPDLVHYLKSVTSFLDANDYKVEDWLQCLGITSFRKEPFTPIENTVAELLKQSGTTVATAESCTGGLVSSRLTDVPGSSAYTIMNAVTYTNDQKESFLGVPAETLRRFTEVSLETAKEMADGIRRKSETTYGISLTGVAGPGGGTTDNPVGTVYIGLSGAGKPTIAKRVNVDPDLSRIDIKRAFSDEALILFRDYITGS